jgi:PAS domain S-box-containing protein
MKKNSKTKGNLFPDQFDLSFKVLAEMSPAGIHVTDNSGKCFYVNPSWCRMAGLTPEEAFGDGWVKTIHKEDRSRLFSEWESFMREEIPWESEYRFLDNNGKITWIYGTATLLKGSDGSIESILRSTVDITERKNFEIKLKESEERLRLACEATGFGTFSYEFESGNAYYSKGFLDLYGLTPFKTLELDHDLVPIALYPDDKKSFLSAMLKANDPLGSGILDIEFRIIRKDGCERWLRTRGLTTFSGNKISDRPLRTIGIVQDITEQKKSEEILKQSQEWERSIFEGSLDAIFISDESSVLIAVNEAASVLTGYSREELLKMRIPDLHDEPDLEAYRKYNKRIFKGEKVLSEARILRKDTTKVDAEFTNSRISISGKYYMHSTARDVTERKNSERKLFEFGERYRLLLENSGLGIGYYGLDGKILMFNHQAIINLGGKPKDYIGKNVTEVFGKEAGQIYIDRFKLASASEKPLKFEDNVNLDGKPGWYMSTITRIFDQFGNIDGVQVIADNITERQSIEEKIRTSEAEYRGLFENSIMGISQTYPHGGYKRINKAYAEMYGYPDIETMLKEVSDSIIKRFSNPDNRQRVIEILGKDGFMPPTEFELKKRNGDKFWALVSAKQVKDDTGKLLYLQADHIDITDRKELEKEMYSSALYARNLIEASLDPLFTINSDGKITDVNSSTEKITGLSRKNLIGSDFLDYFTEPDKAREGYKIVFLKGEVKDYPLTLRHQDGRTTDVLYNATLVKNETGEVQGVFAAARDITEQKKMEEELRKSQELLEKLNQHLVEAIENERNQIALNLHDDLGQKLTSINLDVAWIKGRIGVQSKAVREKIEEMSSMIKETIESIKETSALLRPAILFDLGLVPAIKWQLGIFEKQTGIKCNFYFRPEEFLLADRLSLIIYRILQESLTNIARHSGASKAEINLYVLKNKIELIIKDDGAGIEESKVNSLKSMGIAGMKERVKSVDGKMTFVGVHGSGTIVTVEIPLPKVKTND